MDIRAEGDWQRPSASLHDDQLVWTWSQIMVEAGVGRSGRRGNVGHIGGRRHVAEDGVRATSMKTASPWTHDGKVGLHVGWRH